MTTPGHQAGPTAADDGLAPGNGFAPGDVLPEADMSGPRHAAEPAHAGAHTREVLTALSFADVDDLLASGAVQQA